MQLTQQKMSTRKFGIESNCLVRIFLGYRLEFLAQQHARCEQIAGR